MLRRCAWVLPASFVLAAAFAGEPAPDVSAAVERARQAWRLGDALERDVRAALSTGSADYAKLLERQDAAYENAQQAFRAALRLAPENPLVLAEFGRFWLSRREPGQARKLLEAALRAGRDSKQPGTPAGSALAPPEEADLCRLLGGLLERAGETAAALERYRRAFALDPANPRNRLSLAIAYCAAGTPEEAAALLKPWAREPQPPGATQQPDAADVADRPNGSPGVHALGLYTLALALEETGFPEDALALYRRACTIARQAGQADRAGVAGRADAAVARLEDYFDALQSRAQHRAKENEERRKKNLDPLPDEREACARACALCDHGLKLKTGALEDPGFLEALGRARNGSDEDAKALAQHPHFEAFQGAMEAFQKAVVTAPKLARAYYELGVCSVMLGRPGTARKLLDEAAACSPNNLAVLNLQGEVLLELGQWEDAARVFNKLLMLEPDSGRANFGLARAYAGLQASGEQCRMALDALLNAVRLGVRDRRMVSSQVLVLDDGRELEGYVTEEPQAYLLRRGESAERIEKAKVKEVRQRPGMHERLAALVQRFNSGEKPAPVPVIRSSPGQPRSRPPDALNPWSGTLIEK